MKQCSSQSSVSSPQTEIKVKQCSPQSAVFRSKIQGSSDKNVLYTILSLLGLNTGKKRITSDNSRAVRYGMY